MELPGGARQKRVRDLWRMLTFCSHQEKLAGIAGDREGLSEIEIVGVFGKDLDFVRGCVALSRRCPDLLSVERAIRDRSHFDRNGRYGRQSLVPNLDLSVVRSADLS